MTWSGSASRSVGNSLKKYRTYDETKELGYNIVTGKLSFEVNKIVEIFLFHNFTLGVKSFE